MKKSVIALSLVALLSVDSASNIFASSIIETVECGDKGKKKKKKCCKGNKECTPKEKEAEATK